MDIEDEEDEEGMVEAFTRDLARCHLGRHLRIPLLRCQERVKAALTGADWEGRRGLQGRTGIRKGQEREEHGQGLGVPVAGQLCEVGLDRLRSWDREALLTEAEAVLPEAEVRG